MNSRLNLGICVVVIVNAVFGPLCSVSATTTITLYQNPNYEGWAYPVDLSGQKCINLPEPYAKHTSSVKAGCNCVKFFDVSDCSGIPAKIVYKPPEPLASDFTKLHVDYDNRAVSVQACHPAEVEGANVQLKCGLGWVAQADRCYRLVYKLGRLGSPAQANDVCEVGGGVLASFRNKEEYEWLANYAEFTFEDSKVSPAPILTSGQLVGQRWEWQKSSDPWTFTNWGSRQPLSSGRNLYLMFTLPKSPNWGRWGTIPTNDGSNTYFLCMKIPAELEAADKDSCSGIRQRHHPSRPDNISNQQG